ncbi:hypothetical protein NYA8BAC_01826 [Psychrobacter okhotskensis]|jgi:hypothetical protein|nr:hypothetical protein [Mycobacterium tuberculosis]BBI69655.1 hypothetical protein PKHYL_38460 [Psychrobacter sp. KH172YL61]|tara:strand:+ start:31 stop:267 length:237 start_codon:yes stop_codon:yes gene_type:complete
MTIIRVGRAQVIDFESVYKKGVAIAEALVFEKGTTKDFFSKKMIYGADILKLTMLLIYQGTFLDSNNPIQVLLTSTDI